MGSLPPRSLVMGPGNIQTGTPGFRGPLASWMTTSPESPPGSPAM